VEDFIAHVPEYQEEEIDAASIAFDEEWNCGNSETSRTFRSFLPHQQED
jgi:hypothetical protein